MRWEPEHVEGLVVISTGQQVFSGRGVIASGCGTHVAAAMALLASVSWDRHETGEKLTGPSVDAAGTSYAHRHC